RSHDHHGIRMPARGKFALAFAELESDFLGVLGVLRGSSSFLKSGLRPQRRLGPKHFDELLVRFDVWPADQIDAVRYGGENARYARAAVGIFHALERFADRFRLAGQIDDQGAVAIGARTAIADDRDLARQNRRRHEREADLAHLLTETGHHLVA